MPEIPVTAVLWTEPVPMDTGAPNPVVVREGAVAWVAYLARDPDFAGWQHPSVIDYLNSHPTEPFGVLRFGEVAKLVLGPPNDERLSEHPLYGRGLDYYQFHRVDPGTELNRWIVTFHDETLDVVASTARAFPMCFAATAEEAIESAKEAG
jgi:hypothetical protein